MRLESKSPCSPTVTLESNWLRHQTFSWQWSGGWYYGTVKGKPVKVREAPGGLEYDSPVGQKLEPELREYFRLDEDVATIHETLAHDDPVMASLLKPFANLRILRQDPWECLLAFICSQTNSIDSTATRLDRLAGAYQEPVAMDGVPLRVLPSAERIVEKGKPKLHGAKLGLKRADTIWQVANDVVSKKLELESLAHRSHTEARERLMRYPQIADKIADCVCLFSLNHGGAFPIDRHTGNALKEHYGRAEGKAGLRKWAQGHFGPNAGYASQVLFLSDLG